MSYADIGRNYGISGQTFAVRENSDLWDWIGFDENEEIESAAVDFKMAMREIYEGIELPERNPFE